MSDQATIDDALKKESLDLPDRPAIEDIKAGGIVDSSGEDSLEVWVIISDATQDDELTGESVARIKAAIHNSLLKNGEDRFPYVRIVKRASFEGDEGKSA